MVRAWPVELAQVVYDLLLEMWTDKHIPEWWRWRWLIPLPKKPTAPTLEELRPIMLIEVLRKLWTGLVMDKVHGVINRHGVLQTSQHGFQRAHGTDTANLQLVNVLEEAKTKRLNLYGSSWDMAKAFDSVSKPIIRLAWSRLGVSPDIVDWLVRIDEDSRTVVRSSWASGQWIRQGYAGLADEHYHPDKGTGQGDVSSPQIWVAVFDIPLCALAMVDHPGRFHLTNSKGVRYLAPDVCYADDVVSFSSTLAGLQAQGTMMSLSAHIMGLTLAVGKLRVFKQR